LQHGIGFANQHGGDATRLSAQREMQPVVLAQPHF
jgi:hypothetical protein